MTTEELMEIWHNKPENKNLGARKSAIKFAEYYHQEQVKAGVTPEGDIPYVILKIEKGDGIHTVIECTNCGDVKGMYLGMTCPLCKRAFRDVRTTPTIRG